MIRHKLDLYPMPKDKNPLYINEPWWLDSHLKEFGPHDAMPEKEPDNIRIYLPMDLNRKAIIRRLHMILGRYEKLSEKNELNFYVDFSNLLSEVEVYDQVWFGRNIPKRGNHSYEAIELVKEIITILEKIPVSDAETEPYDTIRELKCEYLGLDE